MKRLTQRDEYGNADVIGGEIGFQMELDFEDMNRVTDALNKLAEYEELGHEPSDIKMILGYVDSIVRDSKPFEADKIHIHCGYLRQFMQHGFCFEQSK